jgi:hypothetical protein
MVVSGYRVLNSRIATLTMSRQSTWRHSTARCFDQLTSAVGGPTIQVFASNFNNSNNPNNLTNPDKLNLITHVTTTTIISLILQFRYLLPVRRRRWCTTARVWLHQDYLYAHVRARRYSRGHVGRVAGALVHHYWHDARWAPPDRTHHSQRSVEYPD